VRDQCFAQQTCA